MKEIERCFVCGGPTVNGESIPGREGQMIESHNDEAIICKAAAILFGEEALLRMAIEECSELTVKISRLLRRQYRPELISKANLAEAVADVQIIMEQLCEIVGPESVSKWKEYNLDGLKTGLRTRNVFVDYEFPDSFSGSDYSLYSLHKAGGNKLQWGHVFSDVEIMP